MGRGNAYVRATVAVGTDSKLGYTKAALAGGAAAGEDSYGYDYLLAVGSDGSFGSPFAAPFAPRTSVVSLTPLRFFDG